MADYPPPSYGMPFPIPTQHPQHHPQHAAPNPQSHPQTSPSDTHQTPISEQFQFNGGLPGLNLQSYAQNAQQQHYQFWPPPSVEQQSAYGALFPPFPAPSAFPLPPPPPLSSAFFAPVPQQLQNAPTPIASNTQPTLPVQPPQKPVAISNDRIVEMMDSDKEEGELSERDSASESPAGPRKPVAAPPRSVPLPSSYIPRTDSRSGRHHPDSSLVNQQHMAHARPSVQASRHRHSSVNQKPTDSNTLEGLPQKREAAKKFVRVLYENNIRYDTLANEGLDPPLLREVYRSLNLPSQPEPIPAPAPAQAQAPAQAAAPAPVPMPKAPSNVNSTAPAGRPTKAPSAAPTPTANGRDAQTRPNTAVKTNVNPPASAKSAPSPIDRKDYIARLQAAKMGKQSSTTKVTPPQNSTPAVDTVSAMLLSAPQATMTSTVATDAASKPPLSEEELARRHRNTEIIKKKIELLKASGKLSGSSPSTPQPSAGATIASTTTIQSQKDDQTQQSSLKTGPTALPTDNESTSQSVQASPFAKIPGLFMNSNPAGQGQSLPTKPPPLPALNGTASSSHKRPVASDFDDPITPRSSGPIYTRPLGQSPHEHDGESMIIEVSDDDDSAGEEMDIDDDQAGPQPPSAFSPPTANQTGTQALRNLPPLSNFPSRAGSVRPVSAVGTPPVRLQAGVDRELSKHEKDILDLKLRIAEMERKKKTAVATKDAISASPAPRKPEPKDVSPKVSTALLASSFVPKPSGTNPSRPDQAMSLSRNDTVEKTREWKRQRRAEIESTLQSLDAGLDGSKTRLAQIEKEMAELRAKSLESERERQRLIQELESFGIDTEGMPDDELHAHRNELQKELESGGPATESSGTTAVHAAINNINDSAQLVHASAPEAAFTSDGVGADTYSPPGPLPITEVKMSDDGPESMLNPELPDPVYPPQLQDAEATVPATVSSDIPTQVAAVLDSATPIDDAEDIYSPEPANPPTERHQAEPSLSQEDPIRSPFEEGEVEMSESTTTTEDEEDYEPEEPTGMVSPQIPTPDNVEMETAMAPAASPSLASTSLTEDEGEVYEPPEPDQQMTDIQPSAETSGSQMAPLEEDGHDAMDISTALSHESTPAQRSSLELADGHSISVNSHAPENSIVVADDLAPELQSQIASSAEALAAEEVSADNDPTRFVPYESPLRMFKSYRYHPHFSQTVPGGFLSMTFSHQIDPVKPLCQFESVGGTCNDPHCEGQHFRGMGITGEKLLVQLGTANPGKTPEEKQKWNDGLRQVLKNLRSNNIKDPEGIALEISKYRRQFFDDDSRVVNL